MKLLYLSQKYKKHSLRVYRHSLRRRFLKRRRQKQITKSIHGKNSEERREWYLRNSYKIIVRAPKNLSFLDNPEDVTNFISRLDAALKENRSLYVNMKLVKNIDYPTIAALLAVLFRSKKEKIKINGNMPKDDLSRDILLKSGFLYTLFSNNPDAGHKHDINADNQVFTLDKRSLNIVKEIVELVSQAVYGKKTKIPGLYTTLGELMDNTASHAAENKDENERWWLSINYDRENKKVKFVFVDYGVGIFTSLLNKKTEHPIKKLLEKAKIIFGPDATDKHLKSIITRSAGNTYKLSGGHGQGIYGIYQALQRKEISNLYLISNNAVGNVTKNNYIRLKKDLNGTLYYWEICGNNV